MKCDQCNKQATVHLIEIKSGKKVEKHLCEQHAGNEGVSTSSPGNPPINQLLEKFVLKHGGEQSSGNVQSCDQCGMTYEEFRRGGLLGCSECYTAFQESLTPLLRRAHQGATQHLGKVPRHAGAGEERAHRLMRLRRQLEQAVAAEDYEKAASVRDEVRQLEGEKS